MVGKKDKSLYNARIGGKTMAVLKLKRGNLLQAETEVEGDEQSSGRPLSTSVSVRQGRKGPWPV